MSFTNRWLSRWVVFVCQLVCMYTKFKKKRSCAH